MKRIFGTIRKIQGKVMKSHLGAYAAQSAFFFVLSLIPFILLLMTMIQFTPITRTNIKDAIEQVLPQSIIPFIMSIVNEVYNQSKAIIPVTLLVALWSAGRGVLAVTSGLNCIYESKETRNYFYLRLRSSVYTVLFLLVIVLCLLLAVFGNRISVFVQFHVPVLIKAMDFLIRIRTMLMTGVMVVFCLLLYRFLPDMKKKTKWKHQIPGAVFAAIGWQVLSLVFSVYLDIFQGFSTMYGSLTTIVLVMLWLYFCMYVILLGGAFNTLIYKDNVDLEHPESQ
ncbi:MULTISPECIES: YihY/virulence factor BrkB family protein [Sellimonas]|uniref:YihY/virulence factor BrkB family protein n=1 Tax=Sellimonas caecigallum TaxID=2592333 RepID=A0ABS7L5W1_9FIRM|nr:MULTISPECIES: YihY/virulence factor BrkB family protein [Sellimonas]MBY0758352.1 YihY/virulence factor BrkB family protein [Sellimonas caecigallum]OUP03128.1 ribonuclease BN [Drancourtella sp. An210]